MESMQISQYWELIKMKQELLYHEIYQVGVHSDHSYLCDRCMDVHGIKTPITEYQFYNFIQFFADRGTMRYCNLCWNWIHLMKWTDETGTHTLRSERR